MQDCFGEKLKVGDLVATKLLRSSLVSRHTEIQGRVMERWASEPKGTVQAPTVGIISSGADWAGPTRHRIIARAWKDLSLSFLRHRCLDTYELLNNLDPSLRSATTNGRRR